MQVTRVSGILVIYVRAHNASSTVADIAVIYVRAHRYAGDKSCLYFSHICEGT